MEVPSPSNMREQVKSLLLQNFCPILHYLTLGPFFGPTARTAAVTGKVPKNSDLFFARTHTCVRECVCVRHVWGRGSRMGVVGGECGWVVELVAASAE